MARGGARDGQGRCACARRSACGAGGGAPPTQVDGPAQGPRCARPRAHAPSTQRPLPRSAFAVPARTALRACAPLAIFTVPACSLGRRATAETASAADARGAGGARARASQAGWCLCAASVRRVRVLSCEFTNPHTNTHKHTGPRGGKCPGVGWAGLKPTQPAQRSSTPGSSPAHSSSAASQLPSERRPGALPPTGAESSGCLRNARHCLRTDGWSVSLCVAACRA